MSINLKMINYKAIIEIGTTIISEDLDKIINFFYFEYTVNYLNS